MKTVKLSDFFRNDFLSVVTSHKNRIQDILNKYEIAIFMARKAICFFDALVANGELKLTNCRILSSRVIDYDGLERFKGKRIAVIDDVVVKGISISRVAEKLSAYEVEADYFVIACEESFSQKFTKQSLSLDKTYHYYTQPEIYKLSALITQYIEASMRTFNVDSPIYGITDGHEVLKNLLIEKGAIDLTSGLQKKYGIINQDLYFNYIGDDRGSLICKVLRKTIIKIRFYCNDEKIIAVPFVLLPECSISTLDLLYKLIQNDDLDALVRCENENIGNENKYKTILYLMAMALFRTFAKNYGILYNDYEYYDLIQFDMPIGKSLNSEQFKSLCDLFLNLEICNVEFSQFEFSKYIKNAYQFISSIDPNKQPYSNWKGELIGKTESAELDFLNKIVFSFKELYKGIIAIQSNGKLACISCIVDVFIDKGFIVPSIVHRGKNNILRAYKMGEFSKLTKEQLLSFVKMIYIYQEEVKRNLDRTEFEKLCVLFFRMQINNHSFGEETTFDEGYYSIGYSYYGPRVSNSREMYTVSKDSALVTDFVERKYVEKKKHGKYRVSFQPIIEDSGLNITCNLFALDYAALNKVFRDHPYKRSANPWNQYIHTYDQYLTILAIGENRKNQILSLCAEIYQVVCLDEEMFFEEFGHLRINQYRPMLSGIDSGLWKYRCFKGDAFKKTTEKIREYGDINALRGIPLVQTTYDHGERIVELRDEMGEFLYRAAYVLNELLRICGRLKWFRFKSFDDTWMPVGDSGKLETIFSISNFFYLKHIKAKIEADIAKTIKLFGEANTIKLFFERVTREARFLLDKCDLFLEKDSPYLRSVKEFIVAYSPGGNLPTYFKRSTESVISNLSEKTKVAVFSIAGELDRNIVIDNLKCDTQDVSDCTYLLFSSLEKDYEGYIEFNNSAKGTYVARNTKTVLKMLDSYPDNNHRLFVLRQKQESNRFSSFNTTKVSLEKESVLASSNYCLDKYLIEREKVLEDNNKGLGSGVVIINDNKGNIALGDGNIQENIFNDNVSTEEITSLIKAVLEAAKSLSPEKQAEVAEYAEVIQDQVASEKPKTSLIKTALEGLKKIVTSEKFINAVSALAPVVLSFIEKVR